MIQNEGARCEALGDKEKGGGEKFLVTPKVIPATAGAKSTASS